MATALQRRGVTAMTMTRYKKLNPDGSGRFQLNDANKETPKPTKSQSAVEYVLFGTFGTLILLAIIALVTTMSPKHKLVPNLVDAGWKQDRINIVVMGIGGSSHPGGGKDLADSILFVSLKPSTKQAAIVSVPRDFWVRIGHYGTHRINMAHEIGNQSGYPGEGPGLMCDTLSGIFNQPVHAFVRIDFSAFEKLVDDLGGVDVYCQRSFYDYLFQDGFQKGWHHLDGKRALKYARLRYVIGPEGDNFARELRQQQVVNAVREKLQKRGPADAMKLIQAASHLSSATDTNLTTTQLISLYRTFHGIQQSDVRSVSLKPLTQIFQVTRITDPGAAVRTRTGDYRELRALAATIFDSRKPVATEDQIQVAATPPPVPQSQAMLMAVQ